MHGGGGLAICGGVGGWRKRWCDDDVLVVGARGPIETAQPSLSLLLSTLAVLPYPSSPACDWNGRVRNLTTTKAPNHPHNTDALHGVKRPGCAHAHGQGKHRNTQPHSRRTVGGGRRAVKDAPRATWQGWRTTPRTPTLWPIECAAEEIGITRRAWSTGVVAAPWAGSDRSEGRRKAHSHSLVAGGGWERIRFLYRCGAIEVGVLYPTAPVGRVMKSVGSNPCQTGHEAITTKLIETSLIGSAHL